jgi:wyosine [tRNA(Phe)-imidazoG37] synthetase (radical SAM superfamily)
MTIEKTFGPVPSRRLGMSLGINNIPPKICTYSCIYCQVGRTNHFADRRRVFTSPKEIVESVKRKVLETQEEGVSIDYLSFVPSGEPTIDANLGREIDLLKNIGIKIAVITNSSLMWKKSVRTDLMKADWVSIKVDTAKENTWRKINRPFKPDLFKCILDGILEFALQYRGNMVTESMLINGINDQPEDIDQLATLLKKINPNTAYLSTPIRPPAEKWVSVTSESTLIKAKWMLGTQLRNVECLMGIRDDDLQLTGQAEKEILSITTVHPLKEGQLREYLKKVRGDWSLIKRLLNDNQLIEKKFNGTNFYMRNPKQPTV